LTKSVVQFTFYSPLKIPSHAISNFERPALVTSTKTVKTILVCDDEPDILRAYQLALRNRYNTITAKSGVECIQKYEAALKAGSKVHAVILDYRLGDMLGDDVARKVRDLGGTKVILISAYEIETSFLEDLKRQNCITIFLKKPFRLSTLISTIEFTIAQ